jgi:hypothetical protein
MQPGDALNVVAQVAVTLAGFAGIVVVFRPELVHQVVGAGQISAAFAPDQFCVAAWLRALWHSSTVARSAASCDLALVQRIYHCDAARIHNHHPRSEALNSTRRVSVGEQGDVLFGTGGRVHRDGAASDQCRILEPLLAVLRRALCASRFRDCAVRPDDIANARPKVNQGRRSEIGNQLRTEKQRGTCCDSQWYFFTR